jgi:hypothetical protein
MSLRFTGKKTGQNLSTDTTYRQDSAEKTYQQDKTYSIGGHNQ